MRKEEKFYYQAQKLFDEGVLREIYKTDNFSLCNVGNAYYVAFLLGDFFKGENIEFMLLLDQEIEFIMKSEVNLAYVYDARPKDQKAIYVFDERACNTMRNSKNRVLIQGPKVNLEKEAQLIEKYGNKNKSR